MSSLHSDSCASVSLASTFVAESSRESLPERLAVTLERNVYLKKVLVYDISGKNFHFRDSPEFFKFSFVYSKVTNQFRF